MAEASNPRNGVALATYMKKSDKLNDLVLKLLWKINGEGETPHTEEEGDEQPFNNSKG